MRKIYYHKQKDPLNCVHCESVLVYPFPFYIGQELFYTPPTEVVHLFCLQNDKNIIYCFY